MQIPQDYILVHDLLEELKLLHRRVDAEGFIMGDEPQLIDPKELLALIEKLRIPAL